MFCRAEFLKTMDNFYTENKIYLLNISQQKSVRRQPLEKMEAFIFGENETTPDLLLESRKYQVSALVDLAYEKN